MTDYIAYANAADSRSSIPSPALEWAWEHRRAFVAGALIAAAILFLLPRERDHLPFDFAGDDTPLFV